MAKSLPRCRQKVFEIMENSPIYPIFGEGFSFREESAAGNGDFARQTLRRKIKRRCGGNPRR
jgi:hypothetical protein